jgi:hypothetical protein
MLEHETIRVEKRQVRDKQGMTAHTRPHKPGTHVLFWPKSSVTSCFFSQGKALLWISIHNITMLKNAYISTKRL